MCSEVKRWFALHLRFRPKQHSIAMEIKKGSLAVSEASYIDDLLSFDTCARKDWR